MEITKDIYDGLKIVERTIALGKDLKTYANRFTEENQAPDLEELELIVFTDKGEPMLTDEGKQAMVDYLEAQGPG